jgi:hypothetical protein
MPGTFLTADVPPEVDYQIIAAYLGRGEADGQWEYFENDLGGAEDEV